MSEETVWHTSSVEVVKRPYHGEAQTKGGFDFQILFQFAKPQHSLNIFDLEPLTRILLKKKSPCK